MRFNAGPGGEAAETLCAWARGAGVLRARLWTIDETVSGMMTSERRIYGGGPGQQRHLLLCDLAAADAPVLMPEGATDVFNDRFWLDFALEAPTLG